MALLDLDLGGDDATQNSHRDRDRERQRQLVEMVHQFHRDMQKIYSLVGLILDPSSGSVSEPDSNSTPDFTQPLSPPPPSQ